MDLSSIVGRFALTPRQVAQAVREAELRSGGDPSTADLHAAARSQSSLNISTLARRVSTTHAWTDLVLPRRQIEQLEEILRAVRYREQVLASWGFEQKMSGGKGVTAMFSGASGTGKTMAASILARELALDLYKIDLSTVVSKYIGETEKNLSEIFRLGQRSNAILFFDEADALFGKRSEVKDAHDRYANLEVAYLLQRMEEYEGVVILATNLAKNIDEAFARRLHHVIEFPFPDTSLRQRIWKLAFPTSAPVDRKVDFAFLARQFELTGGNIRNIALNSAYLAAAKGKRIAMDHVILATGREYQKIGRLPGKSDFLHYYDLLRQGD